MARSTIKSLTTELLTLRAECSALRTQLAARSAPATNCTVHDYADLVEARENCKRLAATELNKRYSFTQVGIRVIARMR